MSGAVPALQRRILDLLEEHDQKVAGIEGAISSFAAATDAMKMAACVGGVFAHGVVEVRGPYPEQVRRNLLTSAWKAAYDHLQVARLASAKDRAGFERSIEQPPPFTLDNLRATFGDYFLRPRFHVLRGLAEVFAGLDPAYRSHSKVRIGVKGLPKRVILTSFAGHSSYGRERLKDIVSALAAYRGEPLPEHAEFAAVDSLHSYFESTAGEAEVRGLKVRVFANRNAHVIFDRGTLDDINRGLAEFYGEVLPDVEADEPAKPRGSTAVSADLQYYPTPPDVVERVLGGFYVRAGERVLEPSCGCGRFLDGLRTRGIEGFGIEVHPTRAAEARRKGHAVRCSNFLDEPPRPEFDAVVMNPPFYGRHYLKHLAHAAAFLKPGGRLVAILPATAWYDHGEVKGSWRDLPTASFAESGTNVPTGYLIQSARAPDAPASSLPRVGRTER